MAIGLAVPLEPGLEKDRRMNDESNAGVSLAALPTGELSPSAVCGVHLGDTGVLSSMGEICEGWIKLHRKLRQHPRKKDPHWVALWIEMLLRATHKPYAMVWCGNEIILQPGQFIAGRVSLSENTGISQDVVRRIVKNLISAQQITQQESNRSSLFTILNWSEYQQTPQQNPQQPPSSPPAAPQQPPTNKNEEEYKEEHIYTSLPVELPHGFPKTEADAIRLAGMAGVPDDYIITIWHTAMSRNGKDSKGQPIDKWMHYVAANRKYWEQGQFVGKNQPNGHHPQSGRRTQEIDEQIKPKML